MFSTMNTPLLDIRASQHNGNVNFSGAFTGYSNNQTVQVTLDVDSEILAQISQPTAMYEDYNYLSDIELMTYHD